MRRIELCDELDRLLEAADVQPDARLGNFRGVLERLRLELSRDELYVNAERTVLCRRFAATGTVEVALRDTPAHTWGPPIRMHA